MRIGQRKVEEQACKAQSPKYMSFCPTQKLTIMLDMAHVFKHFFAFGLPKL